MRAMERVVLDVTEDQLMDMTRDQVTMHLTEKEIAFCENFSGNHNVKMAAIKAGYSPSSASVVGWRIRRKEDPNRYIAWLKVKVARDLHINVTDFLDLYTRIAFADITDYYDLDPRGRIIPIAPELIDGQIVSKIRVNREGFLIELEDRFKALEKLEKYFDVVPADYKQKIEERKIYIMEEKLLLEQTKYNDEKEEILDVGFDDPLVIAMEDSTMEDIWGDDPDPDDDDWGDEED